ncbi:MAG: TetR/AcrR family transcriptional regulator [Solirubrobacteraceae bacterium]
MITFWEHGFEGASLAVLEDATGLSTPSIYNTFGSKEGLYRACLDHYGQHVGQEVTAALDFEHPGREDAARMLRTAASQYTAPGRPHGCMFALGALGVGAQHASITDLCADRRRSLVADLRRYLKAAQRVGTLSAGADIASLARYLAAVLQGMAIQARDGAGRRQLEHLAEHALLAWPEGED